MRTIGLLGGMSWESSIEYERMINEGVRARLGGTHSADLVIRSYEFTVIEALQETGDWNAAGALLAGDARRLQDAGAEIIVLCTNTMHVVAPAIEAAIDVEFGRDRRVHRDRAARRPRRRRRRLLPDDTPTRRGRRCGGPRRTLVVSRNHAGLVDPSEW